MRTLLLADDNITVQRVITLTFADEQIQVVTCADGQQAIDRMAAERPDIVLAATSLPSVSGYDLARFIRNQPELKDVPVLLLSGAFENVDEARLVSSGASGIIEKPVEPNNVIGRVKELLGLKSAAKPATAGRLITPATGPRDKKPPVAAPPRVATPPRVAAPARSTPLKPEQPREHIVVEPAPQPVAEASPKSDDYLGTLDAAFDTLDQQLSGRVANAKPSRNPSGPLGQSSGAPDPRSPGRQPRNETSASAPGNPVFEVDDDWFGAEDSKALADARAGRRDVPDDLRDPGLQVPRAEDAPNAVFEVDDEWFAEDNKARADKLEEHRSLAAEMGIHEVELPPADPVPNRAAPASDLDFDFGLDDIKRLQESAPGPVEQMPHAVVAAPELIAEVPSPNVETEAPIAPEALPALGAAPALEELFAQEAPPASASDHLSSGELPDDLPGLSAVPSPKVEEAFGREGGSQALEVPWAAQASASARADSRELRGDLTDLSAVASAKVADDFAQLLAFEQGEHHEPPMPPAPDVRYVAPEITGEMLDQIAARVADRLTAGPFGDTLKDAMMATIRDVTKVVAFEMSERIIREVASASADRVVRDVAYETSERVVREVASETSERVVREVASETSERVVREVASEASERVVREVASETSERVAREVAAEASARVIRDVVADTSERLVRDEIDRIKSKHQ